MVFTSMVFPNLVDVAISIADRGVGLRPALLLHEARAGAV